MRLFFIGCFFILFLRCDAVLDDIIISGNPGTLSISTATAGSNPNSVSDATTTYSVETLALATRKITGQLSSNMPTGLTLSINLVAPSGATSQGTVALSTTAADLVTNIVALLPVSGLGITYTLSATVSASPAVAQTRTLTFTLL